jgi:plastocyanin
MNSAKKGGTMAKNVFFILGALMAAFWMTAASGQQLQKITITENEYSIEPKEVTVRPGKVEITLVNKGKNPHRLGLRMGEKNIRVGSADGGQTVKAEVDLTPGEYEMSCSLTTGGSHKDKGMVGKLIVK